MHESKRACECAGCACCSGRKVHPRSPGRTYAIAFHLLYPLILYCILSFVLAPDKATGLGISRVASNTIPGQQARLQPTTRGLERPLVLNGTGDEAETPSYEHIPTATLEEAAEGIEYEIPPTSEQQEQIPVLDAEKEQIQQEQDEPQQQEELPAPPMQEESVEEHQQQDIPTTVEEATGSEESPIASSKPSISGLPGNIVKDFEDKEREADESGKPAIKTADGSTGSSPTPLFSNATQPLLAKNTLRTVTRAAVIQTRGAGESTVGRDGGALRARGSVALPATDSPTPSNMATPSQGDVGGKPPKTPKKGPKHGGEGHNGLID